MQKQNGDKVSKLWAHSHVSCKEQHDTPLPRVWGVWGGGGYLPPFSLIPFQTIKAPQFFLQGTHLQPRTLYCHWGSGKALVLTTFLNFLHCEISYLQKSVCNIYAQFKENKKPSTMYTTPNVSNQILPIHWSLLCGAPFPTVSLSLPTPRPATDLTHVLPTPLLFFTVSVRLLYSPNHCFL